MTMFVRIGGATLVAGWLAQALAAPDRDVERGIEAYENREYEAALQHFDAARSNRGDHPELALDRGLALLALERTDEARAAFETASEAETPLVRASAFFELGNLAVDREDWDAAIDHYIEALKARPEHENAKWNLELALLRKQDEEKQQDEQKQDEQEQGEQEQDEQEQDDQQQDDQQQDEQKQDEQKQDEQKQDEQDEQQQNDQGEQEQDEQQQDEQKQGEQEQQDEPQEQQPQGEPLQRMDIDRALQQLDEQDPFSLDRVGGGGFAKPRKDW